MTEVSPDECRPVEVTVDGQPETIRVHGGKEPTQAAVNALSELVRAARDRMAEEGSTVRRTALAVLREHMPVQGRCACGALSARNPTLWSTHAVRALAAAGVLLPLDQRMADQP